MGVHSAPETTDQEQPRLRALRRRQKPGVSASGVGRCYVLRDGTIRSSTGLTTNPQFTFCFKDAAKGFAILSAKDSQAAFLRGLGSKDLIITGDFQEVMWFQGLTAFLQPPKKISPYDRTTF